jgi:hypothetical protein
MSRPVVLALAAVLLLPLALGANPPDPVAQLAARIDALIDARLQAVGIKPAPLAADAEFLRRVYLDLAGRIPSADEARAFLDDKAPDKRRKLVDALLKDPRHVEHFTNIWRQLLIPELATDLNLQLQSTDFDPWLRKQISENVPYDRMVRELLTVPFGSERVRGRGLAMRLEQPALANDPSPRAFYLAKGAKPENLAAATARVFLGVRIECAQCHDHPKAPWTRQQFWGFAAFFAGLSRPAEGGGQIREVFDKREMTIPGGGAVAEAAFLDGAEPQWRFNVGSRVTLAEWLTAPENPYFAKAAANRLWAHFHGTGLVDPEDDQHANNPPSHPELLDELAREFVAHKFDVPFLIRAITASDAYQRTSADKAHGSHPVGSDDSRLFARMAIKRLTPEQLFDSLAAATGYREPAPRPGADLALALLNRGGPRAEFLALFSGGVATRTDVQLSIPQALVLMNGQFVTDATAIKPPELLKTALAKTVLDGPSGRGPTFPWSSPLAAAANDVRLDTAGRVEALFLATLSRRPTAAESAKLVQYVEGGGPAQGPRRALADVFWALLNSAEFIVNH